MFFIQLLAAVFSYVVAKSIWNFVQVRAKVANELPIVWLAKFVGVLVILIVVAGGGLLLFGIAIWTIVTHGGN
jgi:hypothetical protein